MRPPGKTYTRCITAHPLAKTISLELAQTQHQQYVKTLRELGLDVIELPPLDTHPDACFVEDTAVVRAGKAIIASLRPMSRRGEESSVEAILKDYLQCQHVTPPATLEGGDVIQLPERIISGISQRTSAEGVAQMSEWFGCPVDVVRDPDLIHLKSHVTYIDEDIAIGTRRYAGHPALRGLKMLLLPDNEAYAANTLTINGRVLMPAHRPRSAELVRTVGFEVIELDVSEFEKCEGALTCLSIIF